MLDILEGLLYNQIVKRALLFGGDVLKNKIKEMRKGNNVTQEELALAVGVTRQTVISLENGKYNASIQLAYKIAKFFGVTIEELFIFEEE